MERQTFKNPSQKVYFYLLSKTFHSILLIFSRIMTPFKMFLDWNFFSGSNAWPKHKTTLPLQWYNLGVISKVREVILSLQISSCSGSSHKHNAGNSCIIPHVYPPPHCKQQQLNWTRGKHQTIYSNKHVFSEKLFLICLLTRVQAKEVQHS